MENERLIELVVMARQGDRDAVQTLYLDTYRSVYYLALRMVKNPEDAEDITQEVFITVQEKMAELREPAAFYKWANQITVNKCNYLLRKYKGISKLGDDGEILELVDDDPMNLPDKAIDDEDTRRIILGVIDNLPDGQRVCVILYYYQQNTIAQIGDMLEINENTVKSRLALARAKIRAALEEKEKKEGIKLWGIPLALTPILRQAMEEFTVPEGTQARMWENIAKAKTMGTSGQNAPKPEIGGAVAASVPAAAKIGMTLATKIIIGVAATAVVAAGAVFLPPLFGSQNNTTQPDNAPSVSDPSPDITSEPSTAEPDTSHEPPSTQPSALQVDPNARGNSVGNITNSGIVAIQDDRIYYMNFSDGRKLYSMKIDGSDKKKLNDDESSNINIIGGRIYYQSFFDGKLYSMNTDGSDKQKVDDYAGYINIVGDKIYCQSTDGGKLYSMNTDGSGKQKLNDDNSYFINVVEDKIYYCNEDDEGKIYSMNTDGSDRKKLNDDYSIHINVVGDRIYYRNYSDGSKIYSIKTDGSDRKKLNDDESYYINVADGKIYYCNVSDNNYNIYSMNTDGSDRKKLNDDVSTFISVIGDRIYYCRDYGMVTGELCSMNTDGTDWRLVD